jgi:hypothetical protein
MNRIFVSPFVFVPVSVRVSRPIPEVVSIISELI